MILIYQQYLLFSSLLMNNRSIMNSSLRTIILLLLFLLTPKTSWSDVSEIDFLSSYGFTLGVTAYTGELDVFVDGNSPAAGTLSEDISYTPYVLLRSPYKFFGETNIGVLMEYDFTGFSLNNQSIGDEDVDLGTSVDGYSAFVTPTLIVSLTGQQPYGKHNQSLVIGTGFGLGYLRASGDIILTETTLEKKSIDVSGAALALSIFTDYRISNYITRASIGMTSVPRSDFEYRYTGFTLSIGYIFDL